MESGYTALITGASSGIGFEMAKELASHGARVILATRGGPKLKKAHAVPLDVSSEDSVKEAARWCSTRH